MVMVESFHCALSSRSGGRQVSGGRPAISARIHCWNSWARVTAMAFLPGDDVSASASTISLLFLIERPHPPIIGTYSAFFGTIFRSNHGKTKKVWRNYADFHLYHPNFMI